jgi:hypothetical protein
MPVSFCRGHRHLVRDTGEIHRRPFRNPSQSNTAEADWRRFNQCDEELIDLKIQQVFSILPMMFVSTFVSSVQECRFTYCASQVVRDPFDPNRVDRN